MFSKKILIFASCIIFSISIFFSANVFAEDGNYGLDTTAEAAKLPKGEITQIIGNVVGTALSMISVVFFVLMIYGGILWMTAGGNDEKAGQARKIIFAAVIGIIIVMSAYAITNFVLKSVESSGEGSGGSATAETPTVSSLCGKTGEGLASDFDKPSNWASYTCQDEAEAGHLWRTEKCLVRSAYTETAGAGCPGTKKCCAPGGGG